MLVLELKSGSAVRIGDDTIIWVARDSRGQTKLFIDAPREVHVRRAELVPHTTAAKADLTQRPCQYPKSQIQRQPRVNRYGNRT